jgi:type IV fimbrial biogenesis protein FimT
MPLRRSIIRQATPRTPRGMTLIELMIGLAILAFLMLSGAPAFGDWIRNAQVRGASESILTGIQYARTEAVRRNTTTRFQFTDTLAEGCAISATGKNWLVNMDKRTNPEDKGGCAKDLVQNNPNLDRQPLILQRAAVASANSSVIVTIDPDPGVAVVAFNGLGEQTAVDGEDARDLRITISSSQGACAKPDGSGGTVRCLDIVLSRNGQARLCDPGLTRATQPAACEKP